MLSPLFKVILSHSFINIILPLSFVTEIYEQEQKQLIKDTETLEIELNQESEQVDKVEYFLNIVRQYNEIKELSARLVNDLIGKIKVHAVDKSSGQRVQQIDIYYTAVGLIDVTKHTKELAI